MSSHLNRILVTGGAGFIGSHLVDALLQQNKSVTVVDNLFSGKLSNLNSNHPKLEVVEADILEYRLLTELIAQCDAVVHLAAIASVPQSIEQPIYSMQVNTQGMLHVLEAIRQLGVNIPLVYASSAAIYGDTKVLPCRDDTPVIEKTLSPYALQKKQNEEYAGLYASLFDIQSIGLRFFNVYGERQDPRSPYSGVISYFLDAYQQQKSLTIFGDGQQSRDFIHVQDAVRAIFLALNYSTTNVFNVATGSSKTLLELIAAIENAGQRQAPVEFKPARDGDIHSSYACMEKAKRLLGFQSQITLAEGIEQLLKQV